MADTTLFPSEERDKLTLRLQNAVNGFVDAPRGAVEEVDSVLEDAIARLTDTLAERRRTLRTSWQATPARGTEAPSPGIAPGAVPGEASGTGVAPGGTPAVGLAPGETAAPGHGGAAGVAPGDALPTEGGHAEAATTDTEQLRLALRDYRETAERLLRI
ncbi:hypothetical protein [Streptomyces flavofungini]|uniref:hypothetical protein n=1 Tax=Streptomyces flavofungini TaxID=68200 RepID=UPI0034DFBEF4